MTIRLTLATAALTALLLPGCASIAKATGATKSAPNEFNILTKPPLVVPPEYNLRPPRAGEFRAEDAYSSKVAREALLGDVDSAEPSRGEMMLMTMAGAGKADPAVRVAIDGANMVEKKPEGFSDRIMSWKDGSARTPEGAPLDAENEARRLEAVKAATGGGAVTISKRPTSRKLPGL